MAHWLVTNKHKKSVETHEFWEKDGMVIRRVTGWRNGSWIVETSDDQEPVFDDPVDMNYVCYNNIVDVELDSLNDGWFDEVIWPGDMPEEERNRLDELWSQDQNLSWEDDNWDHVETECWVSDGLDIERIEE